MPVEEANAIAAHVMTFKAAGDGVRAAAPGDAAAGERFLREGECYGCHMVRGRGNVPGPDLSNVGRDRTPAQIEQALRDPGGAPAAGSGRGRRGGRGRLIPGRHGPASRWPDPPRDRKERKHLRPSTARARRQAAFAVERPDRRNHPREVAYAEGGCLTGGDAESGGIPQPLEVGTRRKRRSPQANWAPACRSRRSRVRSPAPGLPTTAT